MRGNDLRPGKSRTEDRNGVVREVDRRLGLVLPTSLRDTRRVGDGKESPSGTLGRLTGGRTSDKSYVILCTYTNPTLGPGR